MKGSKKVYAYEPLKNIYKCLLTNIKINNYDDIIIPYNIAISNKTNKTYIHPIKNWTGGSHISLDENKEGYWVDSELLRMDADILKIDCEGCEYDIFSNINYFNFEEIMIEFHKGSKLLVRKMSKVGYDVKIIFEWPGKTHGIIFAKKI